MVCKMELCWYYEDINFGGVGGYGLFVVMVVVLIFDVEMFVIILMKIFVAFAGSFLRGNFFGLR